MEQIKLIAQLGESLAFPEMENAANKWLKENSGKVIVDISLSSFSADPREMGPGIGERGWVIMIRYRERD